MQNDHTAARTSEQFFYPTRRREGHSAAVRLSGGKQLLFSGRFSPFGAALRRTVNRSRALNLHDDRQDHGAALGLFEQIVAQLALDRALDAVPVVDPVV